MLRASSEDAGLDVDLSPTVNGLDPSDAGGGVPSGGLLIAFAEAVVRADDAVDRVRSRLLAELGPDATGHAAATITAFSGLVRVPDGTGIPIDDGLAAVSADIRDALSLEKLGGSANSQLDQVLPARFTSVEALFDNR